MLKLTIRSTAAFFVLVGLLSACAPSLPVTGGKTPAPLLANTAKAPATTIPDTAVPVPTMTMPAASPQAVNPTSAPEQGGAIEVSIENFAFSPVPLTVPAGTKVRWTNKDSAPHTVTSDNGAFDSGTLNNGAIFELVFSQAGTFDYHCNFHPGMVGKIIVTDDGSTNSGSNSNDGTNTNGSSEGNSGSNSGGGSGGYNY